MQDSNRTVIKSDGSLQTFDRRKLERSITNSGHVNPDTILKEISEFPDSHLSTKDIFKIVYQGLRKTNLGHASRYKLKTAIGELGPTGYPFEKFVGKLFENYGYSVQVGVKVDGLCVSHEVDVLCRKGTEEWYVECKYHGVSRGRCDVKIPLYVGARFTDIQNALNKKNNATDPIIGGIYTNTRFTSDARTYGKCSGLELISWDYPSESSLKHQVEVAGLHPITCLSTLSYKNKQRLLAEGVVLCKTLCETPSALNILGISEKAVARILDEAKTTCQIYEN